MATAARRSGGRQRPPAGTRSR